MMGVGVSCRAAVLLWTHAEQRRTSSADASLMYIQRAAVACMLQQILIIKSDFEAF